MKIKDKIIPLSSMSGPHAMRCAVFAAEDTIVKPGVQQLMKCITPVAVMKTALVEPSPASNHGLLTGRTLVDMSTETFYVCTANLSHRPINIKSGTVLAIAEAVDEVEADISQSEVTGGPDLPSHLLDLFDRSSKNLSAEQRGKLKHFLIHHQCAFSRSDDDVGRTSLVKHQIDVGESKPVRVQPRRIPMHRRDEVNQLVENMKSAGVIEESQSPWRSPIVLVRKKNGSTRFCVDYRQLNFVTKKDSYPLPRIDETLDSLSGSVWFSTLDLNSGYWQVEMDSRDKEKTAFTTGHNLYQFTVMPFGLCNAPATFERLMELALKGINGTECLVYLDDIIVLGSSFENHMANLGHVFDRLVCHGLKLKAPKCSLFQDEARYLGHVVSANGVQTDPDKIRAVNDWPVPHTKKEVKSFLGLCAYYRRFIGGFSTIAKPLHVLTEERTPYIWSKECQNAFEMLKKRLTESPILAYPTSDGEFILDCDASHTGLGAVLSQIQDGAEKVIEFYSKTLSKPEQNYCATRKELLAIVKAIEHFNCYLYGRKFRVRSDHSALRWLLSFKNPEGQMARWIERLQGFDFDIQHRPGRIHSNADALSRRPCGDNCLHCNKHETVSVQRLAAVGNDWATAQESDVDLRQVKSWLKNGAKPEWHDIVSQSGTLKSYWSMFDSLHLVNDVVLRKSSEQNEQLDQIIVPVACRTDALTEAHNSTSGGHFGIQKTFQKLRSRFYWPGQRHDTQIWCSKCVICHERKGPSTRNRGQLVPMTTGVPFERVGIDILGPFPVTLRDNRYVIVFMDYFTKWPEAIGIPDMTAETVTNVFITHWVSKYGVPYEIHSDQGRNFEAAVFKQMLNVLGSGKTRTTALHPRCDGLVERHNRTLLDYLAKFVDSEQTDWDKYLPIAMMAYRSAVHDSTKYSPAMMLFGHELALPMDLWRGLTEKPSSSHDFVYNLKLKLHKIHELARAYLKNQVEKMKRNYDERAVRTEFAEGDLVSLYTPTKRKGRSPKLQRDWTGPYKVLKKISPLVYTIHKPPKGKSINVNIERLAKYPISLLDGTSATNGGAV